MHAISLEFVLKTIHRFIYFVWNFSAVVSVVLNQQYSSRLFWFSVKDWQPPCRKFVFEKPEKCVVVTDTHWSWYTKINLEGRGYCRNIRSVAMWRAQWRCKTQVVPAASWGRRHKNLATKVPSWKTGERRLVTEVNTWMKHQKKQNKKKPTA